MFEPDYIYDASYKKMIEQGVFEQIAVQPILHYITRGIKERLTRDEILQAHRQLLQKSTRPDPENPNMWTIEWKGETIWGILTHCAGPNGETIFGMMLSEEY